MWLVTADRPARRQVDSWQAAELLAVEWMRYWGFQDARLTASGPDGGLDVVSSDAVAQVKFKAVQVGAPELQRLFGARGANLHKRLLFFTGTSYSARAQEYAEENGVALFKYDLTGEVAAVNRHAARIARPRQGMVDEKQRQHEQLPQGSSHDHADRSWSGSVVAETGQTRAASTSRTSSSSPRDLNPAVASGCLAAAVLALPATLAVVGFGALTEQPRHPGWAAALGVVGLVSYLFGLAGMAFAVQAVRARRQRGRQALASLLIAGPAVAMWTAVTVAVDGDNPGLGKFIIVAVLVVPPLLIALKRSSGGSTGR